MMNKKEIVTLEHIWVWRDGVLALEDITLPIKENVLLGVIGPNGGGKTTLLYTILGLLKPRRGKVSVCGTSPKEARKLIGYVPQRQFFDLDFPITVFGAVLVARYNGFMKACSKKDREAVDAALKAVDLFDLKNVQAGKLSGGQLQRLFIARALVREPRLLLLDEPTANLDSQMQKSFYELLSRLKKKMSIVLVTHDISAISVYVDEIACLNRKLCYHGDKKMGIKKLAETYQFPVDLILHETPYRVLEKHE